MKTVRFYTFITIALTLIFQIGCASPSIATVESGPPRVTVDAPATIKKADELFTQRENIEKLREAIQTLEMARDPNKRNFEVEWKYAQYNYFLGRQTEGEKEKQKAFETGEKAARIATRIAPEKPDGHFWFGANLGEQAKLSPLTVGIAKVDDIREAMNKVIEIEPGYQGASAFDALARIELETSLMGGSPEKAIEYLEKGLALDKENSNIRLNLARAYLLVDRDADARKQLDYILQMKPDPGYEYEFNENTTEAKKLLESKF